MMRRSHRKSRKGCLECKKRHIKCDETRPHCINCTTVDRRCRYSTPWTPAERSPSDRSASPQNSTTAHAPTPAPTDAVPNIHPFASVEEPHSRVDMAHMELLHHYMTHNTSIYPVDAYMKGIIMPVALREPYVMHSVLALSAHHLSAIRHDRQAFYYNLAIQLQTDALSLFNSIDVGVFGDSVEKRIPVFIFSCLLGFHAFCDALSHRDGDSDTAIARFLGYLALHRGMHTVMHGYWDKLRESELQVIFDELVPRWFQVAGQGHECDDIRERLTSGNMDDDELTAAQHAVDLVQWVLDAKPGPQSRGYVLCSWVAMLERPFVRMLEARRPEALAVLAYFFLAMHHCRRVWMFGGAGQHFLTLLAEHFRGREWYAWVETPYQMLQESLRQEALDGNSSNHGPASHSEDGSCITPVPMARDFLVERPGESDAPRIAEIHLAAMDSNPLLHVQFPTPKSLKALQRFLSTHTAEELRDPTSGVLVARDPGTGLIVAFAKWDSPSHPGSTKLESGDLRNLEGCRREYLDRYASLAEEAKATCFGDRPCYRLSFVCTDPAYQGQGAGSLLTRRILKMAAADGLPVYLESTEWAFRMYERCGFQGLHSFQMDIPLTPASQSTVYLELCMACHPPSPPTGLLGMIGVGRWRFWKS
ncbi:hypothetical protein N658DRAFT_422129 [Parathielavia hyrcaniae]|uniref:Zn(2)-C6 fungal-type domain-containing protein n=1 Tax=Parathielavia hyrcaniae TaxID=113614 RepID=A0AAN6Q965_9PEZI|nr:hypothetical protein N658DRAFT_422129 [Parathielavia hyrcaniae]